MLSVASDSRTVSLHAASSDTGVVRVVTGASGTCLEKDGSAPTAAATAVKGGTAVAATAVSPAAAAPGKAAATKSAIVETETTGTTGTESVFASPRQCTNAGVEYVEPLMSTANIGNPNTFVHRLDSESRTVLAAAVRQALFESKIGGADLSKGRKSATADGALPMYSYAPVEVLGSTASAIGRLPWGKDLGSGNYAAVYLSRVNLRDVLLCSSDIESVPAAASVATIAASTATTSCVTVASQQKVQSGSSSRSQPETVPTHLDVAVKICSAEFGELKKDHFESGARVLTARGEDAVCSMERMDVQSAELCMREFRISRGLELLVRRGVCHAFPITYAGFYVYRPDGVGRVGARDGAVALTACDGAHDNFGAESNCAAFVTVMQRARMTLTQWLWMERTHEEVACMLVQVLLGICAAAEFGAVHNDAYAHNVLVGSAEDCVLQYTMPSGAVLSLRTRGDVALITDWGMCTCPALGPLPKARHARGSDVHDMGADFKVVGADLDARDRMLMAAAAGRSPEIRRIRRRAALRCCVENVPAQHVMLVREMPTWCRDCVAIVTNVANAARKPSLSRLWDRATGATGNTGSRGDSCKSGKANCQQQGCQGMHAGDEIAAAERFCYCVGRADGGDAGHGGGGSGGGGGGGHDHGHGHGDGKRRRSEGASDSSDAAGQGCRSRDMSSPHDSDGDCAWLSAVVRSLADAVERGQLVESGALAAFVEHIASRCFCQHAGVVHIYEALHHSGQGADGRDLSVIAFDLSKASTYAEEFNQVVGDVGMCARA